MSKNVPHLDQASGDFGEGVLFPGAEPVRPPDANTRHGRHRGA